MTVPAPHRQARDRVGRFEIVRFLAAGGMSEVYVARDTLTREDVALKLVGIAPADVPSSRPRLRAPSPADAARALPETAAGSGDDAGRATHVLRSDDVAAASDARFERETRIAARLVHPHIVVARASGRLDDGTGWLAMELLDGEDLDARLARGAVSPRDAVVIALQVCDALAYAHAQGVVHRDVKPRNLFVRAAAPLHAWVLDFGVAHLADEQRLTRTGTVIGTWSYVSPEQARGARDLDHRTDVWSLGVVLYECLAGRLPFDAAGPGLLWQILMEPPVPLEALRPDLPPALVAVVRMALQKSPHERFATIAAMRDALAAVDLRGADSVAPAAADTQARAAPVPLLEAEQRLMSVVCVRGARDAAMVAQLAAAVRGVTVELAGGDQLVVFGADRWNGDEPVRATRLARDAAHVARGASVATGRALRGAGGVTGHVVNAAVALAGMQGGVLLDAATAERVRDEIALGPPPASAPREAAASVKPAAGAGDALAPAAVYGTPWVGRASEQAQLARTLELARDEQRPRVACVLGVPGMGRTRLCLEALARVAARAPDAVSVLVRCDGARRDAPFAALREALALAVDPATAALLAPDTAPGADPAASLDRARAAFAAMLAQLAGADDARGPRPVVLAVDDAQWLDASSVATLRWLCETAPDVPVALWLFARPEGRDLVASIARDASVSELGPLEPAACTELLRAIVGAEPEIVLRRAAGHPLFLEELGRIYRERGAAALDDPDALPLSVEGALLAQLDQLAPVDREFAKRAAVFGETAWLEAVVALGGDPDALGRLRRASLVVLRPASRFAGTRAFALRTEILREVAFRLWPDAARAVLHAGAAAWLATRDETTAAELAHHWDLAGDAPRAAEAHVRAAEAAARLGDTAAARTHAARTLALASEPALRFRALVADDDALQYGADRAARAGGLALMRAQAEALGPVARAEAHARACSFARLGGDYATAQTAGLAALAYADAAASPRWSAIARNELAMVLVARGETAAALARAGEALARAERADEPWLLARTTATLAFVTAEAGQTAEAIALHNRAAEGYARAGDRRAEATARVNAGGLTLDLGRTAEAVPDLLAAIRAADRVGNVRARAVAQHNLGVARRMLGDLAAARAEQAVASRDAEALDHRRLASGVATEGVYLALASGLDASALQDAAARAVQAGDASGEQSLAHDAHDAARRARWRAAAPTRSELVEARAYAAGERDDRRALAAWVAVYEAGGTEPADRAAARAALARLVDRAASSDERATLREALAARYLLPSAIAARAWVFVTARRSQRRARPTAA